MKDTIVTYRNEESTIAEWQLSGNTTESIMEVQEQLSGIRESQY